MLRLVMPYTVSRVVTPWIVRSRVNSNPCFRPAQSWVFVRLVVRRNVRFSCRPCPLSMVVAMLPAGGGTGLPSGGKKRGPLPLLLFPAQARLDVDGQRGLIVLDGEDIIPAVRKDGLA
jgi:hypothetical protein